MRPYSTSSSLNPSVYSCKDSYWGDQGNPMCFTRIPTRYLAEPHWVLWTELAWFLGANINMMCCITAVPKLCKRGLLSDMWFRNFKVSSDLKKRLHRISGGDWSSTASPLGARWLNPPHNETRQASISHHAQNHILVTILSQVSLKASITYRHKLPPFWHYFLGVDVSVPSRSLLCDSFLPLDLRDLDLV